MRVAAVVAIAISVAQQPALHVAVRSRAMQPGELVVVSIAAPAPADAAIHVRAFGRDVAAYRTDSGEWRALVGIDLDVKPGKYVVEARSEAAKAHGALDLIVRPRTFRTRTLTVDPAFVTPPDSERERIEREATLLEEVWRSSAAERLWTMPFVRPVPDPANSAFGTRSIFNGTPRSAHGGADFLSAAGTPVHAPSAGRVAVARGLYFSGNTVVIDHGLGLFSMLAHLSAFDVREGERVTAGQLVGRVGATGRVTGPHLHWAMRVGGARVDPLSVLALLGPQQKATP
jgi:murein DD-endopeptidase MepM/ murein hydrolase activator NlpD